MRRFSLLLLALTTVFTVGLSAHHMHGHDRIAATFQLFNPNGWAHEAQVTLTWDGDSAYGETNNHGLVTLLVPNGVTTAKLSAEQGIFCLPETVVQVSREHPGKYEEYSMDVCLP